jgi:hypothetical protein
MLVYGVNFNHITYLFSSYYLIQRDVKEKLPKTQAKYINRAYSSLFRFRYDKTLLPMIIDDSLFVFLKVKYMNSASILILWKWNDFWQHEMSCCWWLPHYKIQSFVIIDIFWGTEYVGVLRLDHISWFVNIIITLLNLLWLRTLCSL